MIHKGANRYKVVCGDITVLPPEYQRVEYIENSYRQYIDTGWKNNYGKDIYIEAYFKPNTKPTGSKRCALLSNWNGIDYDYNFSLEAHNNSQIRVHCYAKTTDTAADSVLTNVINKVCVKYSSSEKYVSCNDSVVQISHSLQGSCNNNTYIFVDKSQRFSVFSCYYKLYGMKIAENGTLIRKFIPCYRKSDSVAGLYDTVNGVFYTNKGSGSFIVGNNVSTSLQMFTVPEHVEKKYYIRGTATTDFDFNIRYNDNPQTVLESAVIDENGNWGIGYSEKRIRLLQIFFAKKPITSIEFTDNLEYNTIMYYSANSSGTFASCTDLQRVKFAKNTILSGSILYSVFRGCLSLVEIINSDTLLFNNNVTRVSGIPYANTSSYGMFFGCSSLTRLDIPNLDFSNITSAVNFLSGCNSLTYIKAKSETLQCNINLKWCPLTYESMLNVADWLKNYSNGDYVKLGTRNQSCWDNKTMDWYVLQNGEYVVAESFVSGTYYYSKEVQTVTFRKATYDALTQEQKDTLYDIIHTQKKWELATA